MVTNVTKNYHIKKIIYKFDCHILHKILLAIILLLMITFICYHYPKRKSKRKDI